VTTGGASETSGPDPTEIVLVADRGRIRVGNRTESDRDRRARRIAGVRRRLTD